jgi:hypothetical protein
MLQSGVRSSIGKVVRTDYEGLRMNNRSWDGFLGSRQRQKAGVCAKNSGKIN